MEKRIRRRIINFASLIIAIMLSTTSGYSENFTLSGKIFSSTGEPLVGATVTLDNSARGSSSSADGSYSIKVKAGVNIVTVDYVGYKVINQEINISRNTTLNFEMEEAETSINSVYVTAETDALKNKHNIYSVNTIDVSSRLASMQSLTSLVSESSGIRIRRSGGVGSDYDITINGMSGSSIKYYLDGIPLDTKGGDFTLDNIPINIVDRIEVYKGVVPSYLGGDALGGAVDIITKQNQRNYYDISYGYGSFNTHQADVSLQIVEPNTGLMFKPVISYKHSDNNYVVKDVLAVDKELMVEDYGDYERFNDDYTSIYGQLEVGVANKSWADQFYISGSISDTDKGTQTGSTQEVVYGALRSQTQSTNISARYRKENFLVDRLSLNASAAQTWSNSAVIDTVARKYYWSGYSEPTSDGSAERYSTPTIVRYKQPQTNLRANLDYIFNPAHRVNFNYLFNRNSSSTSETETFTDTATEESSTDDLITRHYLGLSYDLNLFDEKWQNTFFVKEYVNAVAYTSSNYSDALEEDAEDEELDESVSLDPNFTQYFTGYGFGSRYRLNDAFAIKASYELGVTLPGITELLGNGDTIESNYTLEPEKSNNYNLNMFGNFTLGNSNLSYDVGGYYRNVKDFITSEVSSDGETYKYTNYSNVRMSGMEAEMTYRLRNSLYLRGNVTYEKAVDMLEVKSEDGKSSAAYMQDIPNRPTFYTNFNVMYNFRDLFSKQDRLTIEYSYQYTKWFYLTWAEYGASEGKETVPSQNNHDISLTYALKDNKYSISAECTNLFDALLYDNYKLQKPGRGIYIKLRAFINTINN